jgi:hypothetical protein
MPLLRGPFSSLSRPLTTDEGTDVVINDGNLYVATMKFNIRFSYTVNALRSPFLRDLCEVGAAFEQHTVRLPVLRSAFDTWHYLQEDTEYNFDCLCDVLEVRDALHLFVYVRTCQPITKFVSRAYYAWHTCDHGQTFDKLLHCDQCVLTRRGVGFQKSNRDPGDRIRIR